MHTAKTLTLTAVAVVLLGATPQARAQDMAQIQLMQTFLDLMTQYYAIIESTHDIASDSEKAAIMQMQKIQEVYEDRGDKAKSVDVLKGVLEDSNNQAIRNAAYLMIGDTLKESGRASEALEYLQRGLDENIEAAD
jgi:tetratricopeptide (TPR) repeat protein